MQEFDLGPNGAMLYCLEYLEKNVDWLMERIQGLEQKYLIFDFPGQVCACVQNSSSFVVAHVIPSARFSCLVWVGSRSSLMPHEFSLQFGEHLRYN